ncbi:MAG: hypothetical protein QNJ35_06745 [Paracoccaceae bacterium]|nr:hypothetical protein [Paracoccaceae bacterium]
MRRLALVLLLAACTPAQQDQIAQDAAKQAVRPVLAEQFPGIPLEPAIDCIIENASRDEILILAADAVTGPTASTIEVMSAITRRPATIECIATEGLPALLAGF